MSLSQQMEHYFDQIANQMEGYEEFEKEAWSFKVGGFYILVPCSRLTMISLNQHDRMSVERRVADAPDGARSRGVRTSDVSRLMELFQVGLTLGSDLNLADF